MAKQFQRVFFSLCSSVFLISFQLLAEPAMESGARKMLNILESGSFARAGSWKLSKPKVIFETNAESKTGNMICEFSGSAEIDSAKGDCPIYSGKIDNLKKLSLWVKLDPDSNVSKLGFQAKDKEGEALFVLFSADWTGWKKIETDFVGGIEQAWKQEGKNSIADFPIGGLNFVWFTKQKGETHIKIDSLEAVFDLKPEQKDPLDIQVAFPEWNPPTIACRPVFAFSNPSQTAAEIELDFLVQKDDRLYTQKPPHPIWGTDHALGTRGWISYDDKRIEDKSLVDGDDSSSNATNWMNDHFSEAFQVVDLGRTINVKAIEFKSSDANWCWLLDVSSSPDGQNFTAVQELQDVNMHKRWGDFFLDFKKPFDARFIQLRYKTPAGEKKPVIRMPSAMMVYDGKEDEKMEFPQRGEKVFSARKQLHVPAGDFLVHVSEMPLLEAGAYLLSAIVRAPGKEEMFYSNYFSFAPAKKSIGETSRFGINSSDITAIPYHKELGIGWVRFENMKWAFISPQKDKFAFDGSVPPWHVEEDKIIKAYVEENGFSFLPYVFQTPRWASSAPEGHKNFRGFPPKDFNDYGTCIFQIVARYAKVKHPENTLLSEDKLSGMGLLKVIELWNEPNLNAESWGPWVGSIDKYFDIFRIGAEAAKKADPSVKVTSCGWAGIDVELISKMKSYKYPDGKCPLDFADILNVHFYSGKSDPETCFVDPNVKRGKRSATQDDNDYETELSHLNEWWNKNKPSSPIWLTETGYDVGGPFGRDERYQAAKLPRCLMMALASGIEKVFVYREIGSKAAQHAGSGLIRDDRTYRPSFFTYATLVRELDGTKPGKVDRLIIKDNPSIWLYLWEKNGEKILSAWNLDDKSELPLRLGKCTVTDSFGTVSTPNIDAHLPLSIFPKYIKNIENFEPVQQLIKEAQVRKNEDAKLKKAYSDKKKYLFDFGGKEFIGQMQKFGDLVDYQPVLSGDVFSKERGWGFDKAALADNTAQWISSSIEKDNCKVRDQSFIVDVKPGTYDLEIFASPFGKEPELVLRTESGDSKLNVSKESPTARTKVKSDGKITIVFKDLFNLAWLRIIESD